MAKLPLWLALASLLSACAGGAPEPKSSAQAEPEAKPDAPEQKPPADADSATRDKQKQSFMAGCEKSPDQHEFCACSFDETSKLLTPEELASENLPPSRMMELRRSIKAACSDKIPEASVRDGFVQGCMSHGPSFAGFCDCTWTELRKSASVKDIVQLQVSDDPRVTSAAKACMTKFPQKKLEADLKTAFLQGCTKKAGAEKFCDCAWTAWRGAMSPAEMVMAGTDSDKARTALEQVKTKCGALAPKPGG